MRGYKFFLFASLAVPIMSAPVAVSENISKKDSNLARRGDVSVTGLLRELFRREPIIEALPESSPYDIIVEGRSEASASEDEVEETLDESEIQDDSDNLEERGVRGGGNNPRGVRGGGNNPRGVRGGGNNPRGVRGGGNNPRGVRGGGNNPRGVRGGGNNPRGVRGGGNNPRGVRGGGNNPRGVRGGGNNPRGVRGGGNNPKRSLFQRAFDGLFESSRD
ncbi:Nn.00g044070.m01.CDS01 [Neocucurbitaria sp. VM-36]